LRGGAEARLPYTTRALPTSWKNDQEQCASLSQKKGSFAVQQNYPFSLKKK